MLSRLLLILTCAFDVLGGGDFVIQIRPGRPASVRGRVPKSKVGEIVAFFGHDLRRVGAATIRGWWVGGTPKLRFSGDIGRADQQRARNFLLDHLR